MLAARAEQSGFGTATITVEQLEISPSHAQMILSSYPYKGQRPLRIDTVIQYASTMAAGRWVQGSVITLAKGPGGRTSLMDGQHRLHAVIRAGIPQQMVLKTHWVLDEREEAVLYSSIDAHLKRSTYDLIDALGLVDALGLPRSDVAFTVAAVRLIRANFGSRKTTPILELEADLYSLARHAQRYFAAIYGGSQDMSAKLRRAPVVAIGLVTFEGADTDEALERTMMFWRGVADDNGLRRGDPRWYLADHLKQFSMSPSSINAPGTQKHDTHRSLAHYAAAAWNRWCDGETSVRQIKLGDVTKPIVAKRTRLAG